MNRRRFLASTSAGLGLAPFGRLGAAPGALLAPDYRKPWRLS